MEPKNVTPEDLFERALELLDKDFKLDSYTFSDDFNLRITLRGDTWDGSIDYRIAKFVLKLQQDIFHIYNSTTCDKLSLKHSHNSIQNVVVRIEVRNGSSEILIKTLPLLNSIADATLGKLSSGEIVTVILTGIFIAAGGWTIKQVVDRISKRAEHAKEEETKVRLFQTMDKIIDTSEKSQRALLSLVSSMQNSDTITLPSYPTPLTHTQAEKLFNITTTQQNPKPYTIDDRYKVTKLDLESSTITLKMQGIRPFTASTKGMQEHEKIAMHRMVTDADINGYVPDIDLQIVAEILDGKISGAQATGIGTKRIHAQSLKDILSTTSSSPKPLMQCDLFD